MMMLAAAALLAPAASAQEAADDEMRALTSNVLAGLRGAEPEAEEEAPRDLGALVQQALQEGQSDDYLEALVAEAADQGEIEVPDAMRTTEGAVDTRTLLASLVSQSEQAQSGDDVVEAVEADAGAGAEPRYYIVVSGDSLAGIAQRFYGDALAYEQIFAANTDQLESPDRISPGQRLVIPQ